LKLNFLTRRLPAMHSTKHEVDCAWPLWPAYLNAARVNFAHHYSFSNEKACLTDILARDKVTYSRKQRSYSHDKIKTIRHVIVKVNSNFRKWAQKQLREPPHSEVPIQTKLICRDQEL